MSSKLKKSIKGYVLLCLGVLSAGLGLEGFVIPNSFVDGGITGISLTVSYVSGVPIAVFLVLFNIPFIILAFRQISKAFALKALLGIILLALCLLFIRYPVVTSDKLLVAVFGGFFLGAGVGLSIRGGGVIDGTEILALHVSRLTSLTIGDIIFIINIVIFSVAALIFGLNNALYSILTYLAASKTIDFLVQGIEEYVGVTVISGSSNEIRHAIINEMGRGVTIYLGRGGFEENSTPRDILYSIVTRLELSRLKSIVEQYDPAAFIAIQKIYDAKGGIIKKRAYHHLK